MKWYASQYFNNVWYVDLYGVAVKQIRLWRELRETKSTWLPFDGTDSSGFSIRPLDEKVIFCNT